MVLKKCEGANQNMAYYKQFGSGSVSVCQSGCNLYPRMGKAVNYTSVENNQTAKLDIN